MGYRWSDALSQLRTLLAQPAAPAEYRAYPELRNFVTDVMKEGKRKNIINLLIDVDVTELRQHIANANIERPGHLSLTACIAMVLAKSVDNDRDMHAYRQGRKKIVLFEEIDLTLMMERDIGDGVLLPVPFIIRNAAQKSAHDIRAEITHAQKTPLGLDGPMSALHTFFFGLPTFLRKIIWWYLRRDPQAFKQVVGTVGITSMGMHGTGSCILLPITPMTLTLSIGTIGKQWKEINGMPTQREILQLNLGADHDLIDGAPLMRFAETLKQKIEGYPKSLF